MGNSYATPADLLLRYDANLLGMLVNDNSQQLSPAQLQNDAATQAALDDATGIIQSALYVAYKYTAAEIATATAESLSLLRRLCCDLAIVMLCQRRGYDYNDKYPMLALSLELIQQLRNGERVLDIGGNEKAGLAAATFPSLCQQRYAGFVVNNQRVFPYRYGWLE